VPTAVIACTTRRGLPRRVCHTLAAPFRFAVISSLRRAARQLPYAATKRSTRVRSVDASRASSAAVSERAMDTVTFRCRGRATPSPTRSSTGS
jgi:hypothetical protein